MRDENFWDLGTQLVLSTAFDIGPIFIHCAWPLLVASFVQGYEPA